jgi:serine/threonine protein kinase
MSISPESAEESARTLDPGTLVGEYKVTHKLGEGGMGVVYAGLHPEIGKRVAIKVLAPQCGVYPELIRRFKEEARAVNRIRHPHIIDIFAFNQLPDGRHYFVMEFLDGESLATRMESGSIEAPELRRLLGQICHALEAAHRAGVVHRDLKPENIWVAKPEFMESYVKLLDFGIAKLTDVTNSKVTQAGLAIGTPHYMPPEQGMGRVADARADVYALGVILYQIFAGTLPFHGGTAQEVMYKHITETPLPPSRHREIVPAAMEQVILDCLEKEPARRPASAKELGARIEAAFEAPGAAPRAAPHDDAAYAMGPRKSSAVPRTLVQQISTQILPSSEPVGAPARREPGMTSLNGMALELEPRAPRRLRSTALVVGGLAVAGGVGVVLFSFARQPVGAARDLEASNRGSNQGASARGAPTEAEAPIVPARRAEAAHEAAEATHEVTEATAVAAPSSITIKIDTLPSGARVVSEAEGAVLGRTPFAGARARADSTLKLKLELDGFKPRVVNVPLAADFERAYELEKRATSGRRSSADVQPTARPGRRAAAPEPEDDFKPMRFR